jgi:hypothetical protein
MTSEADSTPRRRPPTIDLTATEVAAEQPAGATGAEQNAAPGAGRRFHFGRLRPQVAHMIGAAAGAVAVLVIVAALWLAGFGSPPGGAPAAAPPSDTAAVKNISARLDKIETALAGRRPDAPDEALSSRLAAAEAETKALDNTLAALNRRLDDIAVTARSAQTRADGAAAAAAEATKSAAQAGVQHGDIDALANRVAALEHGMTTLSDDVAHRPASADDRAARLTVVAEALRAAVERGVPYASELGAVKSFSVDASALTPLEPFAASGVPEAQTLAQELATLTPALLRASGAAPSENTFLGRLHANAQKIIRVTPVDAPRGDDPGAVLTRADAAASRGDIGSALIELSHLPDGARSVAEPWIKKAQAREAAIAASRRIAADALAALGRPVTQ